MSSLTSKLILSAALAATIFVPIADASAKDKWGHHKHYGQKWQKPYPGHKPFKPYKPHKPANNNNGDAIVLGVIGLAAGAIIGSAIADSRANQPSYARPQPNQGYYPPAPSHNAGYQASGSMEPWSEGWYNWCDNRYRSFNPSTGTYRGYDGVDHFCVAN